MRLSWFYRGFIVVWLREVIARTTSFFHFSVQRYNFYFTYASAREFFHKKVRFLNKKEKSSIDYR